MQVYTEPITRLIEEFSKLPGVGRKTAQRLAFHVVNMNNNDVEALAKAIVDAKREIRYCSIEFSKLPGVGRKTAQRLAFHVVNMNNNDVEALAKAIVDAKREIRYCSICCNITDTDPCSMCSNKNRDKSVICVVEDPRDVAAMERTKD